MEISRHMIQSGKWDMEYKCAYLCTKQWEENLDQEVDLQTGEESQRQAIADKDIARVDYQREQQEETNLVSEEDKEESYAKKKNHPTANVSINYQFQRDASPATTFVTLLNITDHPFTHKPVNDKPNHHLQTSIMSSNLATTFSRPSRPLSTNCNPSKP